MGNGVEKECRGRRNWNPVQAPLKGSFFQSLSSQWRIFLNHTKVLHRLIGVLLGGD